MGSGTAGDMAVFKQEGPPEILGAIMWSLKMEVDPVLGGIMELQAEEP